MNSDAYPKKNDGREQPLLPEIPGEPERPGSGTRDSAALLYMQIYQELRGKIVSGEWPQGTRLPSQRELAARLGVNRSTVVTALGRLAAEGLVQGNRGGGTRVAPADRERAPFSPRTWNDYVEEGSHYPNLPAVQAINRLEFEPGLIRLGTGEPAPELLPQRALQSILAELSLQPLCLSYEEPLGNLRLRTALSAYLRDRGVHVSPGGILVVSGAIQGLQLVALGLLPRNSTVLVEKPSYLYSIHAFQSAGIKFSGLSMDEGGLLPEEVGRRCRDSRAAMLYTIPSFHNPTGTLLDAERRRRLIETAARTGLPILEDGAYHDLWLDAPPPPPIKAMDREGRVLYLGSLSKSVSPGLRIGWVAGPEPVVRRLADIKMQADYGAASLSQLVAAKWLEDGHHERHCSTLREHLRARRDNCLSLLNVHFRDLAEWNRPSGGFYIWLTLRRPIPPAKLFSEALKEGLLLNTGDLYERGDGRHLRLSYAYASGAEMKRGLPALAALIRRLNQKQGG